MHNHDNIGFQTKQNELTKTFMTLLNRKKHLVSMVNNHSVVGINTGSASKPTKQSLNVSALS